MADRDWAQQGRLAYAAGRWDEAIAAFSQALALRESAAGCNDLGAALRQTGRLAQALGCYQRALELNPEHPEALGNLANAWAEAAEPERALALCERAFELACARGDAVAARDAHAALVFSSLSQLPFAEAAAELARFRRLHVVPQRQPAPAARPARMRLGYLSADFCAHTVMGLLAPLFADYDQARYEIYCYAAGQRRDAVSAELAARTHWRELAGLEPAAAERLLRADRLDLLVDLAGYTNAQCLGLLARRPAARIATGLGFIAPLGWADYALLEPAVCSQAAAALVPERLVRIPGNLYYRPDPALALAAPDAGPQPALVLGSANSLFKLNPAVLATWAGILRRLPTALLRLKAVPLADPWVAARLRARFAALGVDPARIETAGPGPRHEVLAWYRGIDLCLDPFPYQGGVTSCEALYMGCPVIALAGAALNTSGALLQAVGLDEYLTATPQAYLEQAVATGQALAALGPEARLTFRQRLRTRLADSRIFDARAFVSGIEAGYAEILAQGLLNQQ